MNWAHARQLSVHFFRKSCSFAPHLRMPGAAGESKEEEPNTAAAIGTNFDADGTPLVFQVLLYGRPAQFLALPSLRRMSSSSLCVLANSSEDSKLAVSEIRQLHSCQCLIHNICLTYCSPVLSLSNIKQLNRPLSSSYSIRQCFNRALNKLRTEIPTYVLLQ